MRGIAGYLHEAISKLQKRQKSLLILLSMGIDQRKQERMWIGWSIARAHVDFVIKCDQLRSQDFAQDAEEIRSGRAAPPDLVDDSTSYEIIQIISKRPQYLA